MPDDTILLLLANAANRELLRDWLGHHYQTIIADSEADLQRSFQLCIVDGPALATFEAAIQARRAAAYPIFLPFLLVTTRGDVKYHTHHLWQTVDELVISPIQKVELQARIEILLRARRLALEVSRLQQAMLSSTQTWLQLAVQSAQIGLWEWDLQTNRVFFSPEWKAQIGYAADELVDSLTVWEELIHPDDRERCLNLLYRYLHRPWPDFALEFRLRHKNGSYRWIRSQAALIYDQHGRPTHMLGAHFDLTERKQMEEEQQQLAEQLFQSQKLEAIGALTSGIAHDLNNLLVPIIGFAEMGMLEVTPDNPLYSDFDQIRAAGIRATALTRRILTFSRQQRMEMKPIHISRVISDFVAILRRIIGERIDIQLQLASDLPPVQADVSQIEQILLNLVINARDAIEGNGTITITTAFVSPEDTDFPWPADVPPGDYIALQISDTGCGIDSAIRSRIFEPFFTTKPSGKGTGLGLATVAAIVKQHHGYIDVQSLPGQGATFTVYLPALKDGAAVSEDVAFSKDQLFGHKTVLVVEDEPAVLHLIASALRLHGYQVIEATDAQYGLGLAASHQGTIDLLITDVMLPTLNGDELYRQLRGLYPQARVLYISAYVDSEHVGPDVTPILAKPFTLQRLLQQVRAILTAAV